MNSSHIFVAIWQILKEPLLWFISIFALVLLLYIFVLHRRLFSRREG